ncbi:MAG TPA: glycosyltransferase family 4 protein [Nitrosopumilaceae archaeon]|nr:glycosyltransferase family 4 protein [Nitrosopumilaceae archaeon]
MKILCVVQRFYPVIGGSEILTKNIMDHLSKNHEVTVYTTNAEDIKSFWNKNGPKISNHDFKNYEVNRFDFLTPTEIKFDEKAKTIPLATNYPGPFSPDMWKNLIVKKIDYDLIFASAFPYDHIIPAYIAAKKWNIPIIIMPLIHQEFPWLYLTSIKLTMLNNCDAIIVLSESERKILVDKGIDKTKISIMPLFIEEGLREDLDPEKFRKSISINPREKIILFIGSKSFVKGVIHLVEAIKIIQKKKPDVHLVLIGPTTKEFKEYFSRLPECTKKKITDLGIVNERDKRNALAACDLLALPSKSESFGLVYLEAWSFKKPLIGCNILPTSEIIENGKDGILVEFGNVQEIVEAITRLINSPLLCEQIGNEGLKKVSKINSKTILKTFEEKCISIVTNLRDKTH